MPDLTRASAIAFADQLRLARHTALGDAEGFDEIIHAVERLGSYLTKEKLGTSAKAEVSINTGTHSPNSPRSRVSL